MSRKWWARCARPTLHAYPPASFLLSAFSFTRPILGLEVRRPVRYIRRCTFVRVCSLTFRQTFDRRCPMWHRRAAVSAPGATAGLSSSAENCPVPCGQRGVWGRLARVSSHDSRSCSHPTLLDKPAVAPGTRHCCTSRQWHPALGTAGQAGSGTRHPALGTAGQASSGTRRQ